MFRDMAGNKLILIIMNYFDKCTTLEEAKKLFKQLCFKCHPDAGGSHSLFLELTKQFENFKASDEQVSDKYFVSKDFIKVVEQLIKINGIDFEICGSWFWITSEKEHKEQIKAVILPDKWICRWAGKKRMWYIRENYKFHKKIKRELSIEEIRDFYGSQSYEQEKQRAISA